jgi:signal peptidase I
MSTNVFAHPVKSGLFLEVAEDLLKRGHRVRFRAKGNSMHPTIRHGEAIVVEPVSAAEVKTNDIALYRTERGVVAHRVIRRADPWVGLTTTRDEAGASSGPTFITRGDAAGDPDEPVSPEQILGKVVAVERRGRSIGLDTRRARTKNIIQVCALRCKRWIALSLSRSLR